MPLDATPHLGGSWWLADSGVARELTREEIERAVAKEVPTFTPHWATCPHAERHRVSRDQLALEL